VHSFVLSDNKNEASVASMIYNGEACWGEEGASPALLSEMGFGTDLMEVDQRWSYIETANPGPLNGITSITSGSFRARMDSPRLVHR